ncbi:hypothetical protein ZOSMA_226G00070 [Zostera marina]|uniref:Uncharacterized protein n=1 Tax=Zostera marina TaxID=29655 RepID=A0A0K9PIX4_ZOSMR|nr:hypothetical protein ZOSMA_226G00070 [Zostera marina]
MRRKQMPSFGDWDHFTDISFSGGCSPKNGNPKPVVKIAEGGGGGGGGEKKKHQHRTSKAVDEDLYKIPPELLYKKPKKKKGLVICDKIKRCFRFSCISSWKS